MSKTKQQILGDICKVITSLSEKSRLNEEAIVNNIVKYLVVHQSGASDVEIIQMASELFNKTVDTPTVQKGIRAGFYNRYGRSFLSVRVKSAKSLAQKMYDVLFNESPYNSLEEEYENTKKYVETLQIAMYAFVDMLPGNELSGYVIKLDKPFSCDCIDALVSYAKVELSTDISDYEKEILRLEAEKNRANSLISRLQDEFDKQLEESKREEQEKLIQQLNSSRYDCILDQLTTIQAGLRKMRRERVAVPLQINSLPALVRQLLQFVEDCGITPMQDIGEEFEISAAEAESYLYQGSPFTANDEIKQVVVVATGWEIREKELILSPPTVQEVQKESAMLEDNAPAAVQQEPQKCVAEETQNIAISMPKETENSETVEQEQKDAETPDAVVASPASVDDDQAKETMCLQIPVEVPNEKKAGEKGGDSGAVADDETINEEVNDNALEGPHSGSDSNNAVTSNNDESPISESKPDVETVEVKPTKLPPIEVIGAACMKMKQDGIIEHNVEEVRASYYPGGKIGGILDKYKRAGLIELDADKTRFIWLATEEKWERYLQKRREGKEQSSMTRQSRQVGGK